MSGAVTNLPAVVQPAGLLVDARTRLPARLLEGEVVEAGRADLPARPAAEQTARAPPVLDAVPVGRNPHGPARSRPNGRPLGADGDRGERTDGDRPGATAPRTYGHARTVDGADRDLAGFVTQALAQDRPGEPLTGVRTSRAHAAYRRAFDGPPPRPAVSFTIP